MVASRVMEAYRPSDDEPFMSDRQRDYFRRKLVAWKPTAFYRAQAAEVSPLCEGIS